MFVWQRVPRCVPTVLPTHFNPFLQIPDKLLGRHRKGGNLSYADSGIINLTYPFQLGNVPYVYASVIDKDVHLNIVCVAEEMIALLLFSVEELGEQRKQDCLWCRLP